MYLKKITIENTGPIDYVEHNFPFDENGNPKPIILIGQNGAGKSIYISQIVNALISAKQSVYEDQEVEQGKVFKYRSPAYIKIGSNYSYSKVIFDNDFFQSEWQLNRTKVNYENECNSLPNNNEWLQIPSNASSHLNSNFREKDEILKEAIDGNCLLYFPANRFEEPGWLNLDNLNNKAEYRFSKKISNYSNRFIINYSPLKDNQNWLLDLLFDRSALEGQTQTISYAMNNGGQVLNVPMNLFLGYQGESTNIITAILKFFKSLFQTTQEIRFGVGKRRSRQVEIIKEEQSWIPNLFNLSTGETLLINIFLTIIKDFDLSKSDFSSLSEIKGIVIIDEVDIHLHSQLQYFVLPELIKLFPKVQFIMTSHSPLFLMGLKNVLGEENFEIVNLPSGEKIDVENFSEFEHAYSYFRESIKFQREVKKEIENSLKPLLFVEGDYDVRYLTKAAELLGETELLNRFKIIDSDGHGNITNVAKHFDSKLAEATPQKIILLYDCDQNKSQTKKGNIFKRVMPTVTTSPITKGIENLFPKETIQKAIQYKNALIDVTPEFTKLVRGNEITVSEQFEVNSSEKKNLCDWIVTNCGAEDFSNFSSIFSILRAVSEE